MLVLSIGMPRAGSGLYYNLTHDLLVAAGYQDARQVRSRYFLQKILTEVNLNIGTLKPHRLLPVLAPSLLGKTYAIKAHAEPTGTARWLMRRTLLRAAYIYRDPRDAMLSAIEHGERSRAGGHKNAFAELASFEQALEFMRFYVWVSEQWLALPETFATRYEDLMSDYDTQTLRLIQALELGIDPGQPAVQAVIERYRPERARQSQESGLHFQKGKVGRFRQVFSPEQQTACNQVFAPYISRMGYDP